MKMDLKIIGYTESQKPIYETFSADDCHRKHSHFDAKDHEEARKFHAARAGGLVQAMRQGDAQAESDYNHHHAQAGDHLCSRYDKHLYQAGHHGAAGFDKREFKEK